MAVDGGNNFDRSAIENLVTNLTVQLDEVLDRIQEAKIRLIDDHTQAELRDIYAASTRQGEDLTATNAKADLARATILDYDTVARVTHAQATVPNANDFFFNGRKMTGPEGVQPVTLPSLAAHFPVSGTLGVGGTNVYTGTTVVCTGGDYLITVASFGWGSGNNVNAVTSLTGTFDGVSMTVLDAWTVCTGSSSSGIAILGLASPASGTGKTLTLTANGVSASGLQEMTIVADVWVDVGSVTRLTGSDQYNVSTNVTTAAATIAATSVLYGCGSHGDAITGANTGTTLASVSNLSGATSGGCVVSGYKTGSGSSQTIAFVSGANDHWMTSIFEIAPAGAATKAPQFKRRKSGLIVPMVRRSV